MGMLGVYSFRAECRDDVDRFLAACTKADILVMCGNGMTVGPGPDVAIELRCPATLTMLQEVMRGIEDGHVMLQTLRECPLKDNHLRREYGLE